MVVFADGIRTQSGVTAVNEFFASEIPEDFLFQRLQGRLFVCVSREERESKGDSVPVHKQPHLNDGVWPVFFAFAVFFAAVFLLDFKVIV